MSEQWGLFSEDDGILICRCSFELDTETAEKFKQLSWQNPDWVEEVLISWASNWKESSHED